MRIATNCLEQLARIEAKLDALTLKEGKYEMATQVTLDRLNKAVTDDTGAVSAATTALTGFIKTVADLTAQLQAAITAGDDDAINAAAAALEANNALLTASVPATAAAVAANLKN